MTTHLHAALFALMKLLEQGNWQIESVCHHAGSQGPAIALVVDTVPFWITDSSLLVHADLRPDAMPPGCAEFAAELREFIMCYDVLIDFDSESQGVERDNFWLLFQGGQWIELPGHIVSADCIREYFH